MRKIDVDTQASTMLRVHKGSGGDGFTEYEEDIHFDADDPDFGDDLGEPTLSMPALSVPIFFTVPTKMSLASVHPVDIHSSHSSLNLSHSLDDESSWSSSVEQVMTIEQLRHQLSSCFTCGVSWNDRHVSLDCAECGGYSMDRPCPTCDGHCGAMWKRDLSRSHSTGKALWLGECLSGVKEPDPAVSSTNSCYRPAAQPLAGEAAAVDAAQDLCQQLERLSPAQS